MAFTGKLLLCLDFDGVLHSYKSGWKGAEVIPDDPVPGATEFLRAALEQFDVHISSARSAGVNGVLAMQQWLHDRAGLRWDEIGKIAFPREKPAAFLTIDDRAMCFTGSWPSMEELKSFRSWVHYNK